MILTSKARYAVMTMVEISDNNSKKPLTLQNISESQNISLSYLEQIFAQLKKAEIVKSIMGPGGGYKLAKQSNKISIASIIKATDEPIKMTRCSSKEKGCINNKTKCKTHHLWQGLENKIYDYLESITLQDL